MATVVHLCVLSLLIIVGSVVEAQPGGPIFYQAPAGHEPRGLDWTRGVQLVQPWGPGQHRLITQADTMAPHLAEHYGLNAIVLQPPLAFNRIGEEFAISDAQFQNALRIYREHGFRIVLYTSIMHAGHEPVWQSGALTRDNPEWTQRDADGHERLSYGSKWIMPIGDPLNYSLNYTLKMIEDYKPDAVMLDNNQFYIANTGPNGSGGITGYGPLATEHFRVWASDQFGGRLQEVAGIEDPNNLTLPDGPGDLYNLWMLWRCAAWAEANQHFRQSMPDSVVLLANIQYLFKTPVLGSDLQYAYLDTMVSETNNRPSWAMSAKMVLGRSLLGPDKPLWNYMGTVQKSADYDEMWPATKTARIVASTLGTRANPWLLYYGFHSKDELNHDSREAISRLLRFRTEHSELHEDGVDAANIGYVFTTRSRMFFNDYPIPKSYYKLQEAGVPCVGVLDEHLPKRLISGGDLANLSYLVADSIRIMTPQEAEALAGWVMRGGTLIATDDLATLDSIARPLNRDMFTKALGTAELHSGPVGSGRLIVAPTKNLPWEVGRLAGVDRYVAKDATDDQTLFIEARPYHQNDGTRVIHLINHQEPIDNPIVLTIPGKHLQGDQVTLLLPGAEPLRLTLIRHDDSAEVRLPGMAAYALLVDGDQP
jgi:hypothetical protein